LYPAVSQVFNLHGTRIDLWLWESSPHLQDEILRYSRSETCATFMLEEDSRKIRPTSV
jgi:hypothetical protein